jgi:hypothetical protein
MKVTNGAGSLKGNLPNSYVSLSNILHSLTFNYGLPSTPDDKLKLNRSKRMQFFFFGILL